MFEKGQLVVCVDADENRYVDYSAPWTRVGTMDGLTRGVVYTVREVGVSTDDDAVEGIRLVELRREKAVIPDYPFAAARFRPLPSSQISLVNSMLITKKAKEPVLSGEQGDAA